MLLYEIKEGEIREGWRGPCSSSLSLNIIKIMISRRMRCVACRMHGGDGKCALNFSKELNGKRQIGKPGHRQVGNIEMDIV
jgi:hypothetical protein